MRIALTGASGFIGAEIARRANEQGIQVTALVRESSRRDHIEPFVDRFVIGDHADESRWGELLENADGVVHNSVEWRKMQGLMGVPDAATFDRHLQTNLVGSLRFLRASAPLPFVFMSTIAVHHDMRPRWKGHPDEDHPLRPSSAYGAYKAAVEAHLWSEHFATGRHTVALRPCGVFGLDPQLARSHGHDLVRRIERGDPLDKAGGGKFVHVECVADATIAALRRPNASGQAFNLVDCYARWADWAKYACEELGIERTIDFSSSDQPQNTFGKALTQDVLGVEISRGHEGIREHLRELIGAMNVSISS